MAEATQLPLPKRGQSPLPNCRPMSIATIWLKPRGINRPLGMEIGLSPGDFVLDGDPAPSPKKGAEPPIFGPCLLWPNGWMDQDATWHGSRPRPRRHCVRWRPSSPPPKQGHSPQFLAQVYCGQTAVWINIPLGMEVRLDPGHIVLDGDPAPPL